MALFSVRLSFASFGVAGFGVGKVFILVNAWQEVARLRPDRLILSKNGISKSEGQAGKAEQGTSSNIMAFIVND